MKIETANIAPLLKVALAAIEHNDAIGEAGRAREAYYAVCRNWKCENGYARYEKMDDEGESKQEMLDSAAAEAQAWADAKRAEFNAKRRLQTAIRQAGRAA